MKYTVEIPEVHKAIVEIELPEGATRDKIVEMAQRLFLDIGSDDLEYSHTLEHDEWTVCDKNGNFVD